MALEKILSEIVEKIKENKNDIGSVSCKIENQKHHLATKLPKGFYLGIINLAIIQEYQIYALSCQLLDSEENGKSHKDILDLFTKEAISCLLKNIKKLSDDVAEFQKLEKKDE